MTLAPPRTKTTEAATVEALARELAQLRRQVRHLSRKPQLTHSAIDDGALVTTVDGQLTQVIGRQYDGTSGAVTVAGPTPPTPVAPTMKAILGGVLVTVSGAFVQDPSLDRPVVAPMDFARFEVEVCDDPSFAGRITRAGVTSASGGDVTVAWAPVGTAVYARVRARSTSGKVSLPSLTTGPVTSGPVGLTDLGFDIADHTGATTISYGTTQPVDPDIGDLWLKEVGTSTGAAGQPPAGTVMYETRRWDGFTWLLTEAQGITDALQQALAAEAAARLRAQYFAQASPPAYTGDPMTAIWTDTDDGNTAYDWSGTAWVKRQLGNGAITPNSLVASNVIATGTITASLLETLLVLATTIVAGNPNGDHARMTSTGFRVYKADPVDGVPNEVVRMGTDTNDYFGVVDANGNLSASIDDTGAGHFSWLTVTNDPLIQGVPFSRWISSASGAGNANTAIAGAQTSIGWVDSSIGGVTTEIGLTEMVVTVATNRWYWIGFDVNYARGTDTEAVFRIRDGGTESPLVTSPEIMRRNFSNGQAFYDVSAFAMGVWYPMTAGTHRLLLTVAAQGSGVIDVRTLNGLPAVICIDQGPRKPISASVNRGGAAAPMPPTTRTVELAPAGWASYAGNGTLRTDVPGPVQGWDPSGYNGDGKGYWWFTLPSITGTVERVEFYVYSHHWYYNSGGTAILNVHAATGTASPSFQKLRTDWHVSGYPKPGGKSVIVPADWNDLFRDASAPRATGISVGPSGGTNLTFYGRFDGPSARLKITYTQ